MNQQPDDPGVRKVGEKPWWESNGVRGSVAAIGSGAGVLIGMLIGAVAFDAVTFGGALASLIGGSLSLYGRITASTAIRAGRG